MVQHKKSIEYFVHPEQAYIHRRKDRKEKEQNVPDISNFYTGKITRKRTRAVS